MVTDELDEDEDDETKRRAKIAELTEQEHTLATKLGLRYIKKRIE